MIENAVMLICRSCKARCEHSSQRLRHSYEYGMQQRQRTNVVLLAGPHWISHMSYEAVAYLLVKQVFLAALTCLFVLYRHRL